MQPRSCSGRVIAVLGPDGSGKSTFAYALIEGPLEDRKVLRLHHRPGLFAARTPTGAEVTDPHGAAPYSKWLSLAKVAFLFTDFRVGWWTKIRPFVKGGGWVVWERPWWDIAIDPARYRLQASGRLARLLGRALPAPDLVFVLEAPVDVLLARKREVTEQELIRQMEELRGVVPPGVRTVFLDSHAPLDMLLDRARTELQNLPYEPERGARWAPVPPATFRWLLPTAPRQAAHASLRIYQPVTIRGLAGWEVARVAAGLGGFRFLPGRAALPIEVTELLAANRIPFRSVALARANHPARFLALLLDDSLRPAGVAKMAFDDNGRAALLREEGAIESAARRLNGQVAPPRVLTASDGLLLLEPVPWSPRAAPWRLPGNVAHAVGAYSASGIERDASAAGAHGDFAPWNLLRANGRWILLDWEHSSDTRPPFFDLWHYFLQAHSLLRRPTEQALIDALNGRRGWIRTALVEYARGAGRDPDDAVRYLDDYIEASAEQLTGKSRKEREALRARLSLQRHISDTRMAR